MEKDNNLTFDAAPSARRIDDNGYLHVSACPISKACINPYYGREIPGAAELGLNPTGIYYGYRDPDELAKAAETFNGLPLLLEHHFDSADEPQKEHRVGATGTDTAFDAPYLRNTISVQDADAIGKIERGEFKELSCSYRYTPDFTPGEVDGVAYDFIMRDIKGNHVALVPRGRAGSDVAVADSMPAGLAINNTPKGELKEMAKFRITEPVQRFKQRRAKALHSVLAADADLGIEKSETELGNLLKAIQVVEAQVEGGYSPRDVGVDIDENATVDEITDKLFPSLEAAAKDKIRAFLLSLKGTKAEDEAAEAVTKPAAKDDEGKMTFAEGVKYGEELEKKPGEREKLDKEHESEGMKKALGEDDELSEKMKDPAFRAAFEMGVKYGEKREKADPKRIDRDHEREGEEKYLAEDALPSILAAERKKIEASFRERNAAAETCQAFLGRKVDPLAYDSADDIYAAALKAEGFNVSEYSPTAYKGMVDALRRSKQTEKWGAGRVAMDSAVSVPDYLQGLNKISVR